MDIPQEKKNEIHQEWINSNNKEVLNNLIEIVIFMDKNMKILWANQAAITSIQKSKKDIIGQFCHQVWFNASEPCLGCPVGVAKETGLAKSSEITTSDGKTWLLRGYPIKNRDGALQYLLQFRLDISEKKDAKKALRASRKQLYHAQKMEALGALVAGIAHEINNPVNLIMYNIPILQQIWIDFMPILADYEHIDPQKKYGGLTFSFLKNKLQKLLSDMDMAANRITKIVDDLKNFSRQSNVAEMEPLDLNQAVKNAIRLAQSSSRKASVVLDVTLADRLPVISGNLHSLEQVILNITINAIQAIDNDDGRIEITTGIQAKEGNVFVAVKDNGQGIQPDIANKLFDPFVTSKHETGGTGLGLSVSYSLVDSHRGKIICANNADRGATFKILLPIESRKEKPKPKVLIVDDEELVRKLLVDVLTIDRSYRVAEASNGTEAYIKLGSFHPDLVVLDLHMPEMDGLEVCRTIKSDPDLRDIKVMITTGYPGNPKLEKIAALGFRDIYYKPLKAVDFLNTVDKILTK